MPASKFAGAGRRLQWEFRVLCPTTRTYCAAIIPAVYISHMTLIFVERR
ncbi:MAG: hypothetical protein MK358_08380 [Vicinamibacterales bacterium]|nr:hypothetical protein [Vicinamibacterales bacterium]